MFLPEGFLQLSTVALLLAAVIVISVVYIFMGSTPESVKTPPGPPALPLLGNLLSLDLKRLDLSLVELSKTYGSVFTVHLGPMKVVVLAGYKTVKEALVDYPEQFGNRLITPIFHDISHGHGIVFANGDSWKEMRRFALSNLRDFGMGRKGSEEKIIEEIQYLTEVFEAHGGKPFETKEPVYCAVSNILATLVYGDRFDYADPVFHSMVNRLISSYNKTIFCFFFSTQIYNVFPLTGVLLKSRRMLMRNIASMMAEINQLVRQLRQTLQENDKRGLIDAFLIKQQKVSGQTDSHFQEDNLINTIVALLAAGTETTGTTLCWGLLLMAKYPHIQKKVQEEIEKVVGTKQPRAEHRRSMPYTDAVIHEIQRLANVIPLNLPHMTAADVHFQGYFIKKAWPLLTSVLQDETQWETPHQFNPAHFLDPEGQFVKKDAFMAFSAGRRACLGESLARMELFLFFTSLLQKFTFTPPPGVQESELDLTPTMRISLNPLPHQLCALRRG
ncbi:CP2K1 protein, partial [Atractosteus spatula]|nr:CP2K1 protein [Atractosteus spatula]